MALKTFFTDLINGNWGDITSPKRVPLKDREVGNAIVNELYSANIADDETTTNVFTTSQTLFDYDFLLKKRGNIVFINGTIRNKSTTTANILSEVCTITNNEFLPNIQQILIGISSNSQKTDLVFNTTGSVSAIFFSVPPLGKINFNGFYFVND